MDFCHQECLEDGAIWAVKGYLLDRLIPIAWSRETACLLKKNQACNDKPEFFGKCWFR